MEAHAAGVGGGDVVVVVAVVVEEREDDVAAHVDAGVVLEVEGRCAAERGAQVGELVALPT